MPGLKKPSTLLVLLCCTGAVTAAVYYFFSSATEDAHSVRNYLIFYAILGAVTPAVYRWVPFTHTPKTLFFTFLFTGILLRTVLFSSGPVTSNDHYRYLWEGKLIANGVSPYFYAPGDTAVKKFAEAGYPEKVAFQKLPSVYPPLSQLLFALAYKVGGFTMSGLKMIALVAEICTLWLLYRLLIHLSLPVQRLLLYAWFPLPVFEFFINNHIDAAGLPLLLGALLFFLNKRYTTAAFFYTGAVLIKLTPLFLLPIFFFAIPEKVQRIRFVLIVIVLIAVAYAPFIFTNNGMGSGLVKYISAWEFNGALYSLLKFMGLPQVLLRQILYAILSSCMLWIAFRRIDLHKKLLFGYILIVLTANTAYPWYFSWIHIFAVLFPIGSVWYLLNAINFSNITPLYYELGYGWHEYPWVLLVQYVPFLVWLAYNLRQEILTESKKIHNK